MKAFIRALALTGLVVLLAPAARAQSLDGAMSAFNAGDYIEAAARFHEVLKFDTDEGNQSEAEFRLAQSFQRMGLYLPAVKYYESIILAGNGHPHYFDAFEGIMDCGDALHDDLKVPSVLDKAYGKSLNKLEKPVLHRINGMLGELAYRQGKPNDAKSFFKTVKPGHPSYAKVQYFTALMKLGLGPKNKDQPRTDEAIKSFREVLKAIPAGTSNAELRTLRKLSTFALARVYYEQAAVLEFENPARKAKLDEAVATYDEIERLSPEWGEALFEKAWTHFLAGEYGQSLGIMHTLQSPYFDGRYQPEMHVLKTVLYYNNCHYDRVYKALKIFEDEYKPMLEDMKKVTAEERDAPLWYELMKKSTDKARLAAPEASTKGDGLIPQRMSRQLAEDARWVKLDGTVTEIDREMAKVKGSTTLGEGNMGEELTTLLEDARKSFVKITGKAAQQLAKQAESELSELLSKGALAKLETSTAETEWLEAGRRLQENVIRRRLPRPFLPNDTFIFWSWRGEYWADEVGYYRYSIKSECIE
ncbi:MAG: hypothetical protein HY904_08955 [Deltaproteobacteria bacterium]|nr:hypothetical protein [Deltaproteobacteria bacterium]